MSETDETSRNVRDWAAAASDLPPDLMAAVLANEGRRAARGEQAAPPPMPHAAPVEPVYLPPPVVVVEPPREFSWRPYLIALFVILLGVIPVGYEYFAYKGVTRLDWNTQVDRDRVIVMEWRTWNAVEGQYETSIEIDLSDPAWPVSNPTCVWQEGTNVVGPWTEPEWRLLCALYEYSPAPNYPVGAITSRHPYDFDVDPLFWRSSYDSYQVGWMRPIFGP
jgi:hypothetical protein